MYEIKFYHFINRKINFRTSYKRITKYLYSVHDNKSTIFNNDYNYTFVLIIYYSVGFTEPALKFDSKLAKVWGGGC